MNYIVLFEDNPDVDNNVRQQYMAEHLAFLARNSNAVKTAGPLSSLAGNPAGGLWLVEADSADDVDELVKNDPFWPTGLRKSVRVLCWRKVFEDGVQLITP